ncbi:SprT family zinc-dependent metalloprotease [Orbus sturtevantii]|uniref:SprT family zinc-dependent metalloprotease n=1 Tax=Orbus sturtevantii TaxID=3074109 RepID=UPI00370D0047
MNQKRVPIQLHNNAITSLRHYLSIANQYFNMVFDEPELIYRKKGSIAGCALLQTWQIQLNINMLLENDTQFIAEVIPHELAHLITYKKFGRVKPHGKEWQAIMENVFQLDAKRTHNFALPESSLQNRHHYHCDCQTHLLTNIRHQKIQSKRTQYHCKNCGTLLRLKMN